MIYILPANPSSKKVTLPTLRSRARREGYRVAHDRAVDSWSLVDLRTNLPLVGLDRVGLHEVCNAIEAVRSHKS
jgi:hypothetical protein